jgi:RNA polymerase sigma-32 factor
MKMTSTALTFPTPASLGNLDQYIQAVNRFPLLTPEQELALGRSLVRDNDLDAAQQLVLSHLRLVVAVSRKYLGYGLPQADLIQEGNIGLMKAVRRFDPERGVRLVSFALHWIRAEIHEYVLRNWRLVKVATTKAQRKLFFNLRRMKVRSASLSTKEAFEIAKDLGVKPEEVFEMETRLTGRDVALDPQPDEDGEAVTPIAYLTDVENEPVHLLERAETENNQAEGLKRALAKLDDRSRRIIEARWLVEKDSATLQELADEYGVSAERIRQIEGKALKTMRSQMAA